MLTATYDAIFIDDHFFGNTEGHDFITYTHTEAGEVIADSVGPLEVGILEGPIFASCSNIELDIHDVATNGGIDAVFRNDDASFQVVAFAQGALPQTNGYRIRKWREFVEKDDLLLFDDNKTTAEI